MTSRRRICILVRAMTGGGAQKDSILLANALAARGHDVAILTLVPEGPLSSLVAPGVLVRAVEAAALRSAVPALRRTILAIAPDVVLSSEAAQNVVAFLAVRSIRRARRPLLLLREVTSPSAASKTDPYIQNRLAYRIIGHVYARASKTLTLTEGARRDLIENFGVPESRVAVLKSNAVLEPAAVARLGDPACRVPREPGLIVSVGRLSAEKGHVTLVKAFAILARRRAGRLVIVGEGPARNDIEAEIRRHGLGERVMLAGFDPDPLAWLLRAELSVSSSTFEGLGNAIVESLACGTPVVATDCPFGPTEILGSGRWGRLVPVGDAAALARGMEEMLSIVPDRDTLRRRAACYTSEAAAVELERVIDCSSSGGPHAQ